MYYALNDIFHNRICGGNKEENANEGNFPHLLPLKEGGEGNALHLHFSSFLTSTQAQSENMCNELSIDAFPIPHIQPHTELCAAQQSQICPHLEHIRSIDVPRWAEQVIEESSA